MALKSGPGSTPFDDLVDSVKKMNSDQNAIAKEAAVYSKELQEHLEKDSMNMSQSQIDAMQDLIMTLKEGRLDDLENDKEQLLRDRMEARRDDERNDSLLDIFKQLKMQFKLLQDAFKGKDGMSIIGLIFRTALVGFVIGLVQGFIKPYMVGIKAISGAVSNVASKAYKFFAFDKLFNAIKLGFTNFRVGFVDLFKNSRLAKFFQGVSKDSLGARFFNQVKLAFKDFGTFGKNIINFVKALGFAFIGLFTGAPTAFKRLADAKLAFSPKGFVFRVLGGLVNFVKKPFTLIINKVRGAFTGLSFALAGIADKIGGLFSQGGKTTIFTKAANRIKDLFAKQGPLSRFFGFFTKIQGVFRGIGQVVGKLLWPLFALIGFIKGATTEAKKEKDTANKIIAGFIGGIGGVFRILIGEFADFLKQALGFLIDLIPGVDGVREKFAQFSFADFFDKIFDAYKNAVLGLLNTIRDSIADIGVGGLIKNIMLSLMSIFMKIAAFPKAIAAGALSAIAAAMPGGESPKEAFSRKFNEVMSKGQAAADAFEAMKEKRDGRDSDGNIIKALSDEGKMLAMEAKREKYPAGPPTQQLSYQNVTGGATVIVNGDAPSEAGMKFKFFNQYSD
jgi:ABC-type multidrug transport system fused ATPase/permease subunit